MTRLSAILLAILVSFALVSCGGGGGEEEDVVVNVKKKKSKVVKVDVASEEASPVNPEQIERNPFIRYMEEDRRECKEGDMRPKCMGKGPLEKFPIRTFRLTTVMAGIGKTRGVVRDKEGNMHSVFVDTKMGRRGGKVVEIHGSMIVVEEPIRWNNDGSVAAVDRIEIVLPEDAR
ncbi:MAG: pilus assembly protein PilP [Deltaproteobacteria bacterium]|nr:pilus assembly protein PilP [Deltaproteobacteria bacterium]